MIGKNLIETFIHKIIDSSKPLFIKSIKIQNEIKFLFIHIHIIYFG